MESSVCGSDSLRTDANLNEATPAVLPVPASDLPKDASGMLTLALECDDAISSTTPDKFSEDLENKTNSLINIEKPSTSCETDADFFTSELSISDVPTEKITENVEDIVQDLENLLGESNDSYRFSRESFDNSKLADSYDQVNSSSVTDLFTLEQTSLDDSSFHCNILPDLNIAGSGNTENEFKETELDESLKLSVAGTTEVIDAVSDIDVELKNIVSIPVDVLKTPEEVSTVTNVNTLMESQTKSEETNNDETPGEVSTVINVNTLTESQIEPEEINNDVTSETNNLPSISSENVIQAEAIQKENVLKSETEAAEEDTILTTVISTNKISPEDIEIDTNSEITEVCKDSEIELHASPNVSEIEIVCKQSVENATELLEELIKDSSSASIESGCLENLLEFTSNNEGEANVEDVEIKGECSIQEENIEILEELKTVLSDEPEAKPTSEVSQILIENSSLESVLLTNVEDEKAEALSQIIIEHSEQEQTTGDKLENDDKSNIIIEIFQKTTPADDSKAFIAPDVKVTHDETAKVEQQETPEPPHVSIHEQNIPAESSTELNEQNVSTRRSTKLVQPLTVEVEDPDCSERQLTEITTQEQTAEKDISSKETQKSEILQPQSGLKQTSSVDIDNQTSRAPLKMTITKHKSDNVHSILKIYDPNDIEPNQEQHIPKLIIKSTPTSTTNDDLEQSEEQVIPKITIKSVLTSTDSQHSPRLTIKPIKPPAANQEIPDKQNSPKTTKPGVSGTGSPRITIKPVVKPESLSPLRLTLRPYPKLEEVPSSPKLNIKPIVKPSEESISSETHHSPKITIKPIVKPPEEIESSSEEKHSPRITIKPILKPPEQLAKDEIHPEEKHSPRITIKPVMKPPEESTEKEEEQHSPRITIKPIIKPPEEALRDELKEEKHSPRITIKPVTKPNEEYTNQETSGHREERHSPKVTIKPIKKPSEEFTKEESESCTDDRQNPRLTIKPIVKQSEDPIKEEIQSYSEERHSPRITIKPVVKPPEEAAKEELQICSEERPSPRITIKPVIKPPDDSTKEEIHSYSEEKHSPRITIKPIIKPSEETVKEEIQSYSEEKHSPRITIKPVIKPPESEAENSHSPRITIKPVLKPQEDSKQIDDMSVIAVQPFKLNIKPIVKPPESSFNPKVTIKPVPKPPEGDNEPIELIDFEDQIKQERIVLKIAKNTKKEKESEKLKKIKVKLSKERGGLACIVPTACDSFKRSSSDQTEQELKHFKPDLPSDLTISLVSSTVTTTNMPDVTITRIDNSGNTLQDESSSSSDARTVSKQTKEQMSSFFSTEEIPDPLADIPVFEITLESATAMSTAPPRPTTILAATLATPPAPRKRGRPRKVPLEVREEFKDPKEEETAPPVVEESTRPKRSCRGASVKATLGIKPRKPRAPSTRGRGGKRTVSTRATTAKKTKERKSSPSKLKLAKESMVKEQSEFKEFEIKDAEFKQVPLPAESGNREVVIYEEETRMSAENTSRAQTPAKQVLTSSTEVVEESQSSVQSNTTTESGEKTQKIRKGPRLEVHQEPEGEVISADKLAEYSWGGGGPYMLQEQVAQFLGIKSFKRKYPGIQRRPVDMQERDFIRESCLASEAMCDMGLTAVRSEDILDIMYTDFQNKYEEYCKHQRDRQAKDVSNKQKALSLAASQEKNKLDIVEQAVQSAFQWNANFNKARREQRRACMDLQTFTVHFPKGKMKQVNKPPIGHYPLALVPGQYTDYYKKYSSLELGNLPLNTIGCKTVSISSVNQDTEESQSDGSGSDSDSSSSDSDSSDSSSGAEDCKMCTPSAHASKKMLVH